MVWFTLLYDKLLRTKFVFFDIYYLLTMLFVYWFLRPLRLVWLLVCCLYKEVYLQIFKCVSFWLHGCCGEWEGGPVNQVNHTSWVAVVTPTYRPKSVRNCCLIELFCGVVCVVFLPFWHFCWCRGFCHRTGSDLLLFVFLILENAFITGSVLLLHKYFLFFNFDTLNCRLYTSNCRLYTSICRLYTSICRLLVFTLQSVD